MRSSAANDWVPFQTFSGYIPSDVYPIELISGDQIRATLSWVGGSIDLDIYLYDSTQNFLA